MEREIDLAGRPTNRATWLARLVVRSSQIAVWLAITLVALPLFWGARRGFAGGNGTALAFLFSRLGATFIKVGQIISTRPDLFSPEFIAPLVSLQDRVPPFRFAEVRRAIEEDFGRKLEEIFVEFEPVPVASASVAQVHRASLHDAELPPTFASRIVAVKVRRPNIVRRADLDEAILRFAARLLAWLPGFELISPLEAVGQFCHAVNQQLDFRIEAANLRRFRENFDGNPRVVIPALVEQLFSDRVLTMEFVHGVKLDKIRAIGDEPLVLARAGIEVACKMTFEHGFIHADLHPGNVLFLPGNRTALLDCGLVGILSREDRRRYALLCYYMFTGQGREAARWFLEAADPRRVRDTEAFEQRFHEIAAEVYDRPVAEIALTGYLTTVYGLLRRHRVRFEATFTIANVAMMVTEGIARRLNPNLNVTREVRPYIEGALAALVKGPATDAVTAARTPTSIAGGRYRIRRLVGEGARKRVYLARDSRLDRDVAVALIRTEGLDAPARQRVTAEARAVARLAEHPRIVPVFDSGEEAGVPYVVSQFMAGGTLSSRLLRASGQRLELEELIRFADQILQALEHAHAHGLAHRDVKPENVWLTEDGFAKLGDFGLARSLGRGDGSSEESTVGTALYMAPEQALGRGGDPRSDLYSFGATLYELLTGHPPFQGDGVAEVIARHLNAPPEPPSLRRADIPAWLDALVLKLLAKAPEDRFPSAASVRQALHDRPATARSGSVGAEPGISASSTAIFVGREQEMARLRKGLEEALAGRGRLLVLVGEPGIGKTRIAELLASYAARRGALILTGRSFEGEGAPAFWPWVQILRSFIAGSDRETLAGALGPGAPYVAQLVPEVREVVPGISQETAHDSDEARFRLFDAVTSFLKRAAASQPLFLFLDDLHWADKPTLLLLHFLARELGGSRILIVGAYRDVDVQYGHPLSETLPSLRRERAFERILLRGLSEDDVGALVTALSGADVPRDYARAIFRETEGNPFFVEETVRHLVDEGVVSGDGGQWTSRPDEIGLPEGIREVIGRRLARLSDPCREVLATAAVLGRDFDRRVLHEVAAVEPSRLDSLLAEARRAQILEADDRRHRFSHALFRETLYAELGAAERVRLHRKIADALHRLYGDEPEAHLSELAYHYFEAAPAGDVDRAIDFSVRAAEHADRQFAYEEAATSYRRALRALETKTRPDEGLQAELLVGLGTAEWRSGEFVKSKETLQRAADLAERAGRPEALARAAIVYSGEELQTIFAAVDQDMVPLLESALAALPAEDSALRAMVMGRLAAALFYSQHQDRRTELFAQASAMAERIGDKRALASVLMNKLLARWGADRLEQLVDDALRFLRLAEELNDVRLRMAAEALQGVVAGETGDMKGADEWFTKAERLAERQPHLQWFAVFIRNAWALVAAEPAEAERLVQRVSEVRTPASNRIELLLSSFHRAMTLWQHGDIEGSEELMRPVVRSYGDQRVLFRFMRPAFWAIVGKEDEIQELLDLLRDVPSIPRDTFWLTQLCISSIVIEAAGATQQARLLYDELLPHDGRAVITGGAYCYGSVSRYLALLAKTLSRLDDACRHFEAAIHFERQMPVWLARTRYEYARTLELRAGPGDRALAIENLVETISVARRYGLKKVVADALALKLELEGVSAASPRSSIDTVTASLEAKGVDVRRVTSPNGTVTLVFTDIEGFSELTERLGDAEAHRLMLAHNEIIRRELAAHDGTEVEAQGDGFLLAFPRATDALRYAIAVQRAFATYRAEHADEQIHVRIGLHTGEPIREGDRFFGKTVVLASRISSHARGDEILLSSIVHELVGGSGDFVFDEGDEVTFTGLSGRHRVFALVWDLRAPARRQAEAPAGRLESENVFRREGDFWTIAYAGRSIRLKDARGLQFLSVLLRRAGEEVHALDLVDGRSAGGTGAVDPALEALDSLRADAEEARAANDTGRAERAEREIQSIAQQLGSAYGLDPGNARGAGAAERARKAVSSRVNDSIARIRKENPELGAHLANSTRLGLFCRYEPERPVRWLM